jgi:predicted NBD/HSP70 family sugar kinase
VVGAARAPKTTGSQSLFHEERFNMNILAVDVGGAHVKMLATGRDIPREFPSGPMLTAEQMVSRVKELTGDRKYDVVSIGYPGPVLHGRPVAEPYNLGMGGSVSTLQQHSAVPSRS